MKTGDRIVADVVEVKENGIHVRHEGRKGLISVVELTWDERKRPVPHEFASEGQSLELLVMAAYAGGFSGSLKRLRPEDDPRRHPALADGRVLAATVRARRTFGVFVDLPMGLVAMLEPRSGPRIEALTVGSAIDVVVTNVEEGVGTISVRLASEAT